MVAFLNQVCYGCIVVVNYNCKLEVKMTTTVTLRAPEALKEALRLEAKKRGISVNALILQILWGWKVEEDKR